MHRVLAVLCVGCGLSLACGGNGTSSGDGDGDGGVSDGDAGSGAGVDTPGFCDGAGSQDPIGNDPDIICFAGDPTTAQSPTSYASIESVFTECEGKPAIQIRLTLDPNFVDNTYGNNSIGWEGTKKGSHAFKELVGSDHSTLLITDGTGNDIMTLTMDYLSEDLSQPSGYGTLCVSGGGSDGEVAPPEMAQYILKCQSSLSENLNERGYSQYSGDDKNNPPDSPPTTDLCTPSPEAPEWDYHVSYSVWIDAEAFGASGYGEAYITEVHASPSKEKEATILVEPSPCCWPIDPGDCSDSQPPPPDDAVPCTDDLDCPGEFCGVEGFCRPPQFPPVE